MNWRERSFYGMIEDISHMAFYGVFLSGIVVGIYMTYANWKLCWFPLLCGFMLTVPFWNDRIK